jgi:homoserine O-succinyltransferase/O-acetyltransferase
MPIVIDGGRVPNLLSRKNRPSSIRSTDEQDTQTGHIRIALINNMPDPALEDTELQFYDLLESAAGDIPVSLKLYSLPGLPHGDSGTQHLSKFYFDIEDLLNSRFDGVIVTGTEPRQPNLREEPYWTALTEVLDWAERNSASAVLSCLAAHAGVLHSDGIPRHRLADKQFGVFDYKKVANHALTQGVGDTMPIPHSRWNEVREEALASCGYEVLTQSVDAGVDLFVKKKKDSLFVHFQGHPEYGAHTLLKEYRRDIKRFVRAERETYPTMPHGYFDAPTTRLLSTFQKKATMNRHEKVLADFPEDTISGAVSGNWQASGATIYRNWLRYLQAPKGDASLHPAMTRAVRG